MKVILYNKKANFNYELLDKYEAGIELKGTEVKSIMNNNINIEDAYVVIKKGELFVINMNISPYEHGNIHNVDPTRNRKLLMHKKEILKLEYRIKKESLTMVITKVYAKGRNIKVEIALAKGKKLHDKRETIKKRDMRKMKKDW